MLALSFIACKSFNFVENIVHLTRSLLCIRAETEAQTFYSLTYRKKKKLFGKHVVKARKVSVEKQELFTLFLSPPDTLKFAWITLEAL